MFRQFSLFLLLLLSGTLKGQNVVISGQATDYAGKKLVFYTFLEPVSHEAFTLSEATVQMDGSFRCTFLLDQTTEIYCDLEKFRGTLVAVPGKSYQIALPPFSPRTTREATSPYFQPELYWLSIKGAEPSELNFLVRAFLTDYNKELATHVPDLYQRRSIDTLNAIVARLDKNYPTGKDPYFGILKKYSFGELELTVKQNNTAQIEEKYFGKTKPVLYHPTYQHLFNTLFTDYLTVQSQDFRQKKTLTTPLQGNFNEFIKLLNTRGFQRETADLIAVKSYYDGYFSGKFDKQLMLKGLKEAEQQTTFTELKNTLPGILSKLNSLQEGKTAPSLLLKDLTGKPATLRSNGKFLYLVFFKSNSKESRQEMDSLAIINQKLATVLEVIPISLDADWKVAGLFWKERKYPWELKFPANPEKTIADFRIKNVPEFYLISPDQKLLLSPAIPPSHNFESLFLKIFRESRFRQGGK